MDNPSTPADLLTLLRAISPPKPNDIDVSELRYVLYARKSTSDEERQEHSIPDQIKDCIEKVVAVHGLKIVGKPIEESQSAKEPGIRPMFNQMIEDIKSGLVDGIVCWHTDRLARNMKEAGEIIDLLDKGILKDIKFATSTFENNPTGKMLLGISFVLSKQYSEHLSENVNRGNRFKTEEGVFIGKMKHGYFINNGRLFPDGNNFALIRKAFEMRLERASQPSIVAWLNSTDYKVRKNNKQPTSYVWDKDSVSKMLKDPVYAGVLKYGDHTVDLSDHYDFEPVVTVSEFFAINKVSDFGSPKLAASMMIKQSPKIKANLLRGMVHCGYCNKRFSSGITSKKTKDDDKRYYYMYRCETMGCEFKGKSVRAKAVLNYAIDFLSEHLFTTEANYENYVSDAKARVKLLNKDLSSAIASKTKFVGSKSQEYENAKSLIAESPELKKHYDLDNIENELSGMRNELERLIDDRNGLKDTVLTYKQYLELFENIGVKLAKTHDMALLDEVLRKFFSNFTIKSFGVGKQQRYEVTYKLNEPWAGFVKSGNIDRGRG